MASKFRNLIGAKCRQSLTANTSNGEAPSVRQIVYRMKLQSSQASARHPISFTLPVSSLGLDPGRVSKFVENFETDASVPSVFCRPDDAESLVFDVDRNSFFARELAIQLRREKQGYEWLRDGLFPEEPPLKIVVEFSSPNVAKPFHMGHLRSTIVGNFVANIHEVVGHRVTRINFLGDWGTQFGYLSAGLAESGKSLDDILMAGNAIQSLYKVYVDANKKSETDASFAGTAKDSFSRLENGDPSLRRDWKAIRDLTVSELEKVYQRLGIKFDHYHGESMYGQDQGREVLQLLSERGLLKLDEHGRQVVDVNDRKVVLCKSDGTSLYITRDVAAAVDRKRLFDPDRVFYVVETGQTFHFENLFEILAQCRFEWSKGLRHVNFGRIEGMSTRKGTAVFLWDILDEGRNQMVERMSQSSNTKVESEGERWQVSDTLSTTAVVMNDLKQRRSKNYAFSWEKALHSKGDSGIKLQYTHARITSLMSNVIGNADIDLVSELLENTEIASNLREPEAVAVVFHIAKFGEVLRDSYLELESTFLVSYLFRLCNLTSKALKKLPVKGEEQQVLLARLAMYAAVKAVLRQAMRVLGVKPVDRM